MSALADPGLAEQRDEPALGSGDRTAELRVEGGDLAGPPDQRPAGWSGARRGGGDREQPVGRNGFRLALQRQGLDRHDRDGLSHQPVGGLADQDLARRGSLLQTGGDVHRVAGGQALGVTGVTGDDLAGVNTGPVLQGDPELGSERDVEVLERLTHAGRGSHGPQRVVLVHPGQAEDRHDRIPDVLLDRPAVALQDGLHRREVQREHLSQRLAVEPVAELRRALQIAEDDRDGLADLLRG